jgi:hypothetical protein
MVGSTLTPCEVQDVLLNPDSVEEINNQHDDHIPLETISDTDAPGWNQQRKSDFFDIKFSNGISLVSLFVMNNSNVDVFELTLVDTDEDQQIKDVKYF